MLNTPYGNKIADLLKKNEMAMFANQKSEKEYFQPFGIPQENSLKKLNELIGGMEKGRKRFFDSYEKDIQEFGGVVLADSGDNKGIPVPPTVYRGFGIGIDPLANIKTLVPKENQDVAHPFLRKNVVMSSASPSGDTSFDLGLEKNRSVKGLGLTPSDFALKMSAGGMSAGGMSAGGMSAGGMSAGGMSASKACFSKQPLGGRYKKGKSMGTPPQLKKWLEHVEKVKKENPDMKYKDILKLAKDTKGSGFSGGLMCINDRVIGSGFSAGMSKKKKVNPEFKKIMEQAKVVLKYKPKPTRKLKGGFNLIDQNVLQGTQLGGKKAPKQLNKWLEHVKKVKEANPNMIYKDILIKAKESYK